MQKTWAQAMMTMICSFLNTVFRLWEEGAEGKEGAYAQWKNRRLRANCD